MHGKGDLKTMSNYPDGMGELPSERDDEYDELQSTEKYLCPLCIDDGTKCKNGNHCVACCDNECQVTKKNHPLQCCNECGEMIDKAWEKNKEDLQSTETIEEQDIFYDRGIAEYEHEKKLNDLHILDEPKWFTERGFIWRTLENKRLRMEKNGHNTKPVISRVSTEEDEREYEFWHQLPRGNPNLLPSLPKEYVK